jgi:hypothetical protein
MAKRAVKGAEAFDHDHDGRVGGSLPKAKRGKPQEPGYAFQSGDQVLCRRNYKMLMTVDEQPYSENNATEFYVCTPSAEHASAHGKGRSTRWWREEDLIAA